MMKDYKLIDFNNHFETLFSITTVACFFIHFLWMILFHITDIYTLVYYNLFSVFLFILAYLILRKGYLKTWYTLLHLEITMHMSLASLSLGAESGFHYYFFILAFASFMVPICGLMMRLTLVGCSIAIYFTLRFVIIPEPVSSIAPFYMNLWKIHNIIIVFIIFILLAINFRRNIEYLEVVANTDPLTSLLNRRAMFNRIQLEHKKQDRIYSLIIIDIDNFKRFNDQFGHECGDLVLKECSHTIRKMIRKQDCIARWGGEEFLVLLPEMPVEEAYQMAEDIRNKVSHNAYMYDQNDLKISITLGVANSSEYERISEVINAADKALIFGKEQGKDRVVVA